MKKTENGLPGEDVFEGIFKDISLQTGWVTFDLNHANLRLQSDFFVCFEFLNVEWQQTEGYFSIVCSETSNPSQGQFVRMTGLANWQQALPGQKHIYAIGAEVYSVK